MLRRTVKEVGADEVNTEKKSEQDCCGGLAVVLLKFCCKWEKIEWDCEKCDCETKTV